MKQRIISILICYCILIGKTFSIGADIAAGFGAGITKSLLPILEPVARETVIDSINHFKSLISGATCPVSCRSSVLCRSKTVLNMCKDTCQKVENIGGYTLRIRFGNNWSLSKCVRRGVMSGHQTSLGHLSFCNREDENIISETKSESKGEFSKKLSKKKLNKQKQKNLQKDRISVAIYSQKDLDAIMKLISLQMAAQEIIDTGGKNLEPDVLKKADLTAPNLVKEADELIVQISNSIKKNICTGKYGDQ